MQSRGIHFTVARENSTHTETHGESAAGAATGGGGSHSKSGETDGNFKRFTLTAILTDSATEPNLQSMQAQPAPQCTDHAIELRNWFIDHFYNGVASSMPPLSDATLQSADALALLERVRAMHQGRLRERALLTADAQSRARLYAFEGIAVLSYAHNRTADDQPFKCQHCFSPCICSASPATVERGHGHHCRTPIARRANLAFYSRGDCARARPARRTARQLPGRSESADAVHRLCSRRCHRQ